jgi:hypothetical protein
MYCRDVACYVSTRPYFVVRSRKMSMLFSEISLGILKKQIPHLKTVHFVFEP